LIIKIAKFQQAVPAKPEYCLCYYIMIFYILIRFFKSFLKFLLISTTFLCKFTRFYILEIFFKLRKSWGGARVAIACSPRVASKHLRFFDFEFNNTSRYVPQTATFEEQLKQYEASCQDWRKHHQTYPLLGQSARILFCFMATSVPCEGIFSDAGYTLWERRTALSAEKSEKIVLIQHNDKCSRI
jgi:hypothetical protein